MSKVTPLASAPITNADRLIIELVTPPTILIRWPDQPTVCPPSRFDATATAVMRVLAAARVTMSQIKARER